MTVTRVAGVWRIMSVVVEVEHVFKDYTLGEQQVQALKDITLQIEDGSFLAIAGPSGSGKSTLLNLIGCIDSPSRGSIRIDGQDVGGKTPDQLADLRARTIGFIFQTFNLFPVLSARENVEYPLLQLREVSTKERRERASKYLEIVGLTRFASHRPNQLSGGQRQRVAIARALATHPRIVLADEPTANLDHSTGDGILKLMKKINQEFKTTFIFSTHDSRVMEMADRVVRIEDGVLTDAAQVASSGAAAAMPAGTLPADMGLSDSVFDGLPVAALRERANAFLYIRHSDTYMTAPWHINTEGPVWLVSRSSIEVGDAAQYIQAQLVAKVPFYCEFDALVAAARTSGIRVDGWPGA